MYCACMSHELVDVAERISVVDVDVVVVSPSYEVLVGENNAVY